VTADSYNYSLGQVNRAGDYLSDNTRGNLDLDTYIESIKVLNAFRAEHQSPLTRVTAGLRSMVRTAAGPPVVAAQRLKREPQMVAKLRRFPGMKLARMEDIGGCRTVLLNEEDLRAVLERIRRTWELKRFRDYIVDPKPEGYRGVHLIVERHKRRIEVQLRTTGQQQWADAIENFAGRWNLPLKDGVGPDEVLNYFLAAAEGVARDERALPRDPELEAYFQDTVEGMRRWVQEQ